MLSMSHRAPGYRLNSQVPPTFSALSSTRVRIPSCRSRCNMYRPENPAPTTRASNCASASLAISRLQVTKRSPLVSRANVLSTHRAPLPRTGRTAEIYTVTDLVSMSEGGAGVKVPFTWKVTGWFMVGWSPEFPVGEVRPLHYFGEDLVAYRDEFGELHVLEAHCKHLGAHIGHGGSVVGDCVQCPFHGWRWGPDGTNRYIPYQPERSNRAVRLLE